MDVSVRGVKNIMMSFSMIQIKRVIALDVKIKGGLLKNKNSLS